MNWVRSTLIAIAAALLGLSAHAQDRYASIIVDADTLDVVHARQIDAPRHPASLTKIMTLYLVFDAIERGELTLETPVTVSTKAARTPPVKMGLKTGQSVTLDTLIQAVAVRSSNDAAVVLAEAVSGSEEVFAIRMTEKARALGMQRTDFRNASGLPHDEQVTTARDMAKLAHATLTHFPQYYHYFGQTEFQGKKNTNRLLTDRNDVDGFKTGYTRASGYNLVISAVRDKRRLIAIVLGGASSGSRNAHMDDLIERGFDVMSQTPAPAVKTVRVVEPIPVREATPVSTEFRNPTLWAIQIDGFRSQAAAEIATDALVRYAGEGQFSPRSGFRDGIPTFSARVEGLSADRARTLCQSSPDILGLSDRRCLVLSTAG